jgi:hypothetical protein
MNADKPAVPEKILRGDRQVHGVPQSCVKNSQINVIKLYYLAFIEI